MSEEPQLKEFEVTLPINGVVYLTVTAESQEEAIDKALESYEPSDLESWSAYKHLVRGNIFYGECSDAEAVEVK